MDHARDVCQDTHHPDQDIVYGFPQDVQHQTTVEYAQHAIQDIIWIAQQNNAHKRQPRDHNSQALISTVESKIRTVYAPNAATTTPYRMVHAQQQAKTLNVRQPFPTQPVSNATTRMPTTQTTTISVPPTEPTAKCSMYKMETALIVIKITHCGVECVSTTPCQRQREECSLEPERSLLRISY